MNFPQVKIRYNLPTEGTFLWFGQRNLIILGYNFSVPYPSVLSELEVFESLEPDPRGPPDPSISSGFTS